MSNPLTPTSSVFIPVEVNSASIPNDVKRLIYTNIFLKELPNQYVLSESELRLLLEGAWEAGNRYGFADGADISQHVEADTKEQYLKTILP